MSLVQEAERVKQRMKDCPFLLLRGEHWQPRLKSHSTLAGLTAEQEEEKVLKVQIEQVEADSEQVHGKLKGFHSMVNKETECLKAKESGASFASARLMQSIASVMVFAFDWICSMQISGLSETRQRKGLPPCMRPFSCSRPDWVSGLYSQVVRLWAWTNLSIVASKGAVAILLVLQRSQESC